jgi:hypothetical protein
LIYQKQKAMTNQIPQNNLYRIYDSMGRPTSIYITASNIKDACKLAKKEAADNKIGQFYKVKRCYNGGVRG